MKKGGWASLLVQFVEDREGRALVRLPNGSETSVVHGALHPMMVEYRILVGVKDEIGPGDIYEDCGYHPVLCTYRDGDEVRGISLIDGSQPRSCSLTHCGVVKMEVARAVPAVDRAWEEGLGGGRPE